MSYPYGYGRSTADLATLRDRYGARMHPEYARRLFAWLRAQDGRIGIGSAWRKTPHHASAASRAGHSFHQDQTFADGVTGCAAVDLVARNGSKIHRSPTWDEVPRQGSDDAKRWGLHANVTGEPWHLQPLELDGWRTWDRNGRPAPAAGYQIPGDPAGLGAPGHGPPTDARRFDPIHGRYSLWPHSNTKPVIDYGDRGDAVRYCQAVIRRNRRDWRTLAVDGIYGHITTHAVETVQEDHALVIDGVVGRQTWPVIDALALS